MKIELNELEIRILLKCFNKPLSKRDVTQKFHRAPIAERALAIDHLLESSLIESKALPKPNSKKTPIFYFITNSGKKWINSYNENYPG